LEAERIESLRRILETEQCRPIAYEEALEVGESLINFFEVLADDSQRVEVAEPAL
jgi:hypothetical protein